MDEIGLIDMPAAINRIVEVTRRPVNVFAHCVGAVGMEIAIATGKLGSQQVASLAINAIHPWVQPAPANRVRAKLGVFFRDVLGNDLFDPIPQTKSTVSATQSILDRFAFSFARLDEELVDHHNQSPKHAIANAICDRMTFLYGRMWRHANLRAAGVTHHCPDGMRPMIIIIQRCGKRSTGSKQPSRRIRSPMRQRDIGACRRWHSAARRSSGRIGSRCCCGD